MFLFVLIPLLPFVAFLALAFGGRWLKGESHRIGIPAIVASFGLSLLAFIHVYRYGPFALPLYTLFHVGNLEVHLGLYVDHMAVLLLMLVTGVSSLVHIYSSTYMQGDPRYNRFFAVIALFTFSMLMVVTSTNLLMLYIFWEIMGICSYLLISHWADRPSACKAATKAFLVNAVADVGLSFGIILAFATFGTLDIQSILSEAPRIADQTMNLLGWLGFEWHVSVVTVISLFLFMGAVGKSSQIPLHIWLPFAMEAPTPVSALIHAATMVNAGVFLVARLSPLIVYSPVAMIVIAVIGAGTAVFGALVSLTQNDIKRILAYSTMSQIGFMIMACGIGAYVAAMFHLLAHGALKAFLFLSTGNALQNIGESHDLPHEQEGRRLLSNGSWAVDMAALLLAVIPPFVIFSAPYERMWTAVYPFPSRYVFWAIGLITVFYTAFSVFRLMASLFERPVSFDWMGRWQNVEDSPRVFSASLAAGVCIMTIGTVSLLLVCWSWFLGFVGPVFASSAQLDFGEPTVSVSPWGLLPMLVALAGWGMGLYCQRRSPSHSPWVTGKRNALYVALLNKGYVDEFYDVVIVRPTLTFARWLWQTVDVGIIDRAINNIALVSVGVARWLWQTIDVGTIDRTVTGLGGQSLSLGRWLWQAIDIRGIGRAVDAFGRRAGTTGQSLQTVEPRMLQHHMLVLIFIVVLTMAALFWLMRET